MMAASDGTHTHTHIRSTQPHTHTRKLIRMLIRTVCAQFLSVCARTQEPAQAYISGSPLIYGVLPAPTKMFCAKHFVMCVCVAQVQRRRSSTVQCIWVPERSQIGHVDRSSIVDVAVGRDVDKRSHMLQTRRLLLLLLCLIYSLNILVIDVGCGACVCLNFSRARSHQILKSNLNINTLVAGLR